MRDLQVADHDRPVVEQSAEQRLLHFDRTDAREPNGRGATAQRPVDDEELLRRQNDVRPLPKPHGPHDEQGREKQEDGADDRRRPADRDREGAGHGQRDGTHERACEHDPVPPLVDTDLLTRRSDQGVAGFAAQGRIPRS